MEPYLPDWAASVRQQRDKNFELVVGVDAVHIDILARLLGEAVHVKWIFAANGVTPAQVRQKAMTQIVSEYDIVIFADSDDILGPRRVETAKRNLRENDVTACAMRLIDESGKDLGLQFNPQPGDTAGSILPRFNIFGLSNSAYRTKILKNCLPIPKECVLVDWFVATRAWLFGARMDFDPTCHMAYRQYGHNTARVLPPFSAKQVLKATQLVLSHDDLVFQYIVPMYPKSISMFAKARSEVREFFMAIDRDRNLLDMYVTALNQLPPRHIWWSCVAHPKLQAIWKN